MKLVTVKSLPIGQDFWLAFVRFKKLEDATESEDKNNLCYCQIENNKAWCYIAEHTLVTLEL